MEGERTESLIKYINRWVPDTKKKFLIKNFKVEKGLKNVPHSDKEDLKKTTKFWVFFKEAPQAKKIKLKKR